MPRDALFPTRVSIEAATEEAKAQLAQQMREGEIVVTPNRTRPLYFDGRFLTAADLTADQAYVQHRMSDMGRMLGFGVINGLRVSRAVNNARAGINITSGHGLTPSGEMVALAPTGPHFVAFDDLDVQQRVELQLGLRTKAHTTSSSRRLRTGLFVLALRPVEYDANPVPSYPTSLDGERSVRHGEIIEAVAITLVPYTERSPANASPEQRRAQVAREVFFERSHDTALQDALPLAVMLFESGQLVWIDEHLARREVGTESGLAVTLNPRPRAALEAWFTQYRQQLEGLASSGPFLASQVFSALPPVGPIPAASIEWEQGFEAGLRQSYFPSQVDAEFSFVAEDELPVLISEGLALPPIDLRADEATLDHLALMILAPVPRKQQEDIRRNLSTARSAIRLKTPTLTTVRSPIANLVQLGALRPSFTANTANAATSLASLTMATLRPTFPELKPQADTIDAAWKRAFEEALKVSQAHYGGMFFYMRRRQLPYSTEVSGYTLRLSGDAGQIDTELATRLKADASADIFKEATGKSPTLTRTELINVLASPRLALSPKLSSGVLAVSDLLRRGAMAEVLQAAKSSDEGTVKHDDAMAISQRFGADGLGEGWQRLLNVEPKLQSEKAVQVIAASRVIPQIDRMAADLPDEGISKLGQQLLKLAQANKSDDIAALVK